MNLSPSEQKKNGPLFDLAMAIAALKELKVIKDDISWRRKNFGYSHLGSDDSKKNEFK